LGQSSGSVDNINSKKSRPNGTSLEAAALDLLKQANSNISKDAVCNIHGNASNRRFASVRRAPCASGTKSVISVFFAFPPHPVQLTPITHNGVEVVPMAQGSWAETLICLPERDF